MIKRIKNYFPHFLAFLLGILAYNLYSLINFNNLEVDNDVECSIIYNTSVVKDFLYSSYIDVKEYELNLCEKKLELLKK
tara:strand:- start:423 stop:659 length:237 start_codon:yes stop_codon:yes gene_type:complete